MLMRTVVVAALGLIVIAGPAAAIEASGHAVAVLRTTSASGPGGERTLAAKGPVFSGDVINTDRRGTAQLLFADDTKMVIGPNSQVTIDKFVFQGASTASSFAINALRGSFRFITGKSAKTVYSIETPTASIGVRGTQFDGHVAKDGTTTIAMWDGTVRICDKATPRRHCTQISGACSVIQLDPRERFNWVNDVYERTALIDRSVPFAFRQQRLLREFRVSSRGCEIHNLDPAPRTDSKPDAPPPSPRRQDRVSAVLSAARRPRP